MVNSRESWNRIPSTASALFAIELPYRPPKHPVGAYIWRWRVWLETTVGLSLLEPWEKVFMLVIIYLLLTLTMTGLYKYLPDRLSLLQDRMTYYFFGHQTVQRVSVHRLVAGLVGRNSTEF